MEGNVKPGSGLLVVFRRKTANGQNVTSSFTTLFSVNDHLGSTRVVMDAAGNILERNAYYPFGMQTDQGNDFPNMSSTLTALYPRYINPSATRRDLYNGKEIQTIAGTDYLDYGFRQYDPVTARWMAVDPKAEKYLLTPYSYCAENPVSLLDPQGDSLWINYKNNNYLYLNGTVYNSDGSEYFGKIKGYLKDVKNALELLNSTTEGKSMIDELQSSSNSFIIQNGDKNDFTAKNQNNAQANIPEVHKAYGYCSSSNGSGGIITWNPTILDSGLNEKGNTFRPAFIGLGHEMAHASDANKGYLFKGSYHWKQPLKQKIRSTGLIFDLEYNGLLKSEWRAVYRENLIRKQAGYSQREYYSNNGDGPRLLTPDNKPINYPIK